MGRHRTREARLATELERVAAELRDGEATLYGYRVERDDGTAEHGGVAYSSGWFSFEFEREPNR